VKVEIAAGVFLIVAPIWFNGTFLLLARRFDYPEILRRPADEILERFHAGGPSLIVLWWMFMLSGLLLIPAGVLLGQALGFTGVVPLAVAIGVLAGFAQMLGLLRWVYLVPSLARMNADPALDRGQRVANIAVFQAMHQYLGVGIGEHLGYLFTGIWSILIGVAIVRGELIPSWMGWVGIVIGAGVTIGSVEFLGPNQERGWKLAGAAIPVLYVAWSLWLLALGIALIV
jgi:Domain of unknown function (DUF4386)